MQYPLSTPYDVSTTAEEVATGVDLFGKTALVTGGASGLGLETVRTLAARGARVIVPARNTMTARAALGDLAEVRQMDLLDASSIRAFSEDM